MPGAPRGTRGGISVVHNFPANGEYRFQMWFEHTTMGEMFGRIKAGEQIDISIDGERLALLDVDRWLSTSDPNGASMETEPVFVTGGPHRVSAAFIKLADGPVEDLTSPHEWSLVDRQIGVNGYGITALAHLKDLVVLGPYNPSGLSDTPSRRAIFHCRPASPEEERPCAEEIVIRLASKAFRGPPTSSAIETIMVLYDQSAGQGGFEEGVRMALQGILAMPDFVFRFEEAPAGLEAGQTYRIPDNALASRLSFFLWGSPPDDELLEVARAGRLAEADVLEAQARRMLADPRSFALASRFAAQWLRLEDLEKLHPDRLQYPDFYQQLSDDMRLETEMFFHWLIRDDRSETLAWLVSGQELVIQAWCANRQGVLLIHVGFGVFKGTHATCHGVILAAVAVGNSLLRQNGKPRGVSLEHLLGYFPNQTLLSSDVGPGHVYGNADPETWCRSVECAMPGIPMPAKQGARWALHSNRFWIATIANLRFRTLR